MLRKQIHIPLQEIQQILNQSINSNRSNWLLEYFSAASFGATSEAKINTMCQLFVDIYTDKLWVIENNANGGINGSENITYIASGGDTATTANKFYPVYNIMSKTGLYHGNFLNANTPIKESYETNINTMRKYGEIQSIKNALFFKNET